LRGPNSELAGSTRIRHLGARKSFPMVKKRVDCEDCRYLKRAPYEVPRTGCWHPDFMQQRQKDAFLDEQQIPGDHEKINLRGDCPKWEPKAAKLSFWKRMLAGEF